MNLKNDEFEDGDVEDDDVEGDEFEDIDVEDGIHQHGHVVDP